MNTQRRAPADQAPSWLGLGLVLLLTTWTHVAVRTMQQVNWSPIDTYVRPYYFK